MRGFLLGFVTGMGAGAGFAVAFAFLVGCGAVVDGDYDVDADALTMDDAVVLEDIPEETNDDAVSPDEGPDGPAEDSHVDDAEQPDEVELEVEAPGDDVAPDDAPDPPDDSPPPEDAPPPDDAPDVPEAEAGRPCNGPYVGSSVAGGPNTRYELVALPGDCTVSTCAAHSGDVRISVTGVSSTVSTDCDGVPMGGGLLQEFWVDARGWIVLVVWCGVSDCSWSIAVDCPCEETL